MSDGDQIFGRSAARCRRLSAPPHSQRAGLSRFTLGSESINRPIDDLAYRERRPAVKINAVAGLFLADPRCAAG